MNSKDNSTSGLPQAWATKLRDEIVGTIDSRVEETIQSLPKDYFTSLSEEDLLAHLKALIAVRICDIKQEIMLRHPDQRKITFISHDNYPGLLADLIGRLPDEGDLVGAQIFSSNDKQFVIDVFEFKQTDDQARDPVERNPLAEIIEKVVEITKADKSMVSEFVAAYDPSNSILNSPDEIAKQFIALDQTRNTDDLAVIWEVRSLDKSNDADSPSQSRRYAKVVVSSTGTTTRAIFQRAANFFAHFQIDIERAFCENIRLNEQTTAALLTFHIKIDADTLDRAREQFPNCSSELDGDVLRERFISYLRLDEEVVSKWLMPETSLAEHFFSPFEAELFCGLARLTGYAIAFANDIELSREQVFRRLIRYDAITRQVLRLFLIRFGMSTDTPAGDEAISLASITDTSDRLIVKTFLELAQRIERCNLPLENRRSLAFRLPGNLISNANHGEPPFCTFYVYGNGFDAFHVRFRDVARGGMRIVPTRNAQHYLFESARTFDEAFRLSSAQQLKNKDIAEGGAKAVIVLRPETQNEIAGRDFVDGLLDLVTKIKATTANDIPTADQEYLYLGPDENVTNSLIDWIVFRASQRGYPLPETIMSSKPLTGINHKEFGVTSEGVTVFLHRALLECDFDPINKPFTVKMTGGPDGDVGGNEIRILIREYGNNVKIVAIADGTGGAHDPNGLDHQELVRLVEQGQGISQFSKHKLSDNGKVCDVSNEEGVAWRNNLHFSVASDVFVPAGGRPSAINKDNWKKFLDSSGKPTSKIIVEGANLFITDDARQYLSELGVIIVKDSSANKCGVICSSLEIIAGMTLTSEEFLEIKSEYVVELLNLLRSLARIEANSLFVERVRQPNKTLPEISVIISRQIIRVADVITDSVEDWTNQEQEFANAFILDFLPKSLTKKAGRDFIKKIPSVYRRQLIAAILSSRIVYREGCRNICDMKEDDLKRLVRDQLVYEQQIQTLVAEVKNSDLPDPQSIISILDHAGARAKRELKY